MPINYINVSPSFALASLESTCLCAVSVVSVEIAELGWKIFFLWEDRSFPPNYLKYICCMLLLTG